MPGSQDLGFCCLSNGQQQKEFRVIGSEVDPGFKPRPFQEAYPWAVISQRMTGGCYTSSGSLGRSCERAGPLQEFMGSSHPWASTPSASGCAEPLAPAGEGRLPASAPNSAFRDAGCWLRIGHGGSTCTIVTGKCCHFNFYRTRLS